MKKIYVAGSINMDLVIKTDIFPKKGMTVMGKDFMTNPGGKGANQAVAIAKCQNDIKMIGAVGKAFGDELLNALKNYHVDTKYVKRINDVSSGIAVIIINDTDNRIILDSGSNGKVTTDFIKESLKEGEEGDYFLAQLEIPVKTVEESIIYAKEKGMITILNPAPAGELNKEIFKFIDYFIPNQSECEFYTGIYPENLEDAKRAGEMLLSQDIKNVIITLGKLGAIAICNDGSIYEKARIVDAIDTTAAGDTFVGVTTAFLAKGYAINDAMHYANIASSITIQRTGAQQAIPTLEEIKAYEEKSND